MEEGESEGGRRVLERGMEKRHKRKEKRKGLEQEGR